MASISALLWYVLLSVFWARDAELATRKAYEVGLVWLATTLVYIALASGDADSIILWFWRSLFALCGVLALAAVPVLVSGNFERLAVFGGGPNVYGRLMGLWGIAALYLSRRDRSWYVLAAPVSLLLVVLSGSRGAMIATAASLMVFVFAERVSLRAILLGAVATAIVGVLVFALTPIGELALTIYQERFVALTLLQRHTAGRENFYRLAIDLGLSEPVFGTGLAGFAATGFDLYPHNFFLEIFCETGIVGLLLAALTFAFPASQVRRVDSSILAGFALILVACQFSGDLFDSRGIFLFIVLSMASAVTVGRLDSPAGRAAGETLVKRALNRRRSFLPGRHR